MRQFFNGLRLIYPGENDFIDQIKLKLSERNDLGDAPKAQWNNLEKCWMNMKMKLLNVIMQWRLPVWRVASNE